MKNLLIAFLLLFDPGMIMAQYSCVNNNKTSFIEHFQTIQSNINKLYEYYVFGTSGETNFKISEICTSSFLKRLENANDYDTEGYATWLLRSGMQDGDDSPSRVLSIIPGAENTVIVNWSDMGHLGSTTFTMVESDGQWKIDNATVPEGFNPL